MSHSAWAETNSLTANAPERAGTTTQSRSLMDTRAASASALVSGVRTTATLTALASGTPASRAADRAATWARCSSVSSSSWGGL